MHLKNYYLIYNKMESTKVIRESQKKAIQKYRDTHREEINRKARERYELLKHDDKAYEYRKKQMLEIQTSRQKEMTERKREIRKLMRIDL
jgi:hypothetical protein